MRKLATTLGCLVVAAYATIAMSHEQANQLVAKCHFGD
jgi:hypothetical protein